MNQLIKIRNGDLDLCASGQLIIDGKSAVTLTIEDDGRPLNIEIKFDSNSENNSAAYHKVTGINKETNTIMIAVFNCGTGTTTYCRSPFILGDAFGRKLYFLYMVEGFDGDKEWEKMKRLDYTFYLGKEVANG